MGGKEGASDHVAQGRYELISEMEVESVTLLLLHSNNFVLSLALSLLAICF